MLVKKNLDIVYKKALDMGAVECHIIDATKEFSYVDEAMQSGNLMYEKSYISISFSFIKTINR